jgi:hypothetical protein
MLLHQPAEGAFAVGVTHGAEGRVQLGLKIQQVAVVRKGPVVAPQLAHEGVAVLQRHVPLRGLADVGDHMAALDGVALDQLGHGRHAGGLVVHEQAQASALEKGDAKAIGMFAGAGGKA